jgi:hypothetical protein
MALGRALAESCPNSPTLELGPTLLVALAAGGGAGAGWWFTGGRRARREERQSLTLAFLPLVLAAIYLFWPGVAPHVGWTLLVGSLALTVLLMIKQGQWGWNADAGLTYGRLVAVLLACVVGALYLRTLGPTVGQADTFEFQVVAPKLGIAHPTGYPLYILSGKLFSWLPLGSIAWRVNLTSAVFGVLVVLLVHQIIYRLTERPLVALIASLALACSRVFWSQAVVAEVYTLHNMFVALVMLLLSGVVRGKRWVLSSRGEEDGASDHEQGIDRARRGLNLLYLLSFVLGLSFANHLTTALLLPAVALTLVFVRPHVGWRGWLIAAGLFVLGLSPYLYIFLRWPMLHDGTWMSLGEFWRYVTGQQFGGALRLDAWHTDPTRYEIIGRLLREPFGWPGLILGAFGLLWLTGKKPHLALVTALTFLAYAWYALSYYVPDVAVFLLPAHVILAVWLGLGMAGTLDAHRGLAQRAGFSARMGSITLLALFALLPLALLWTNLAAVDQSDEREAYVWGERVLELPLARDAAILADSARISPLYYLQRIEGRRPDLDMLVLADETTYRAELEARLAAGQTVYLARFLPGLEGLYHLRSVGPLTEVGTAPLMEPPALDGALGISFARAVEAGVARVPNIELLGLIGPGPGPDGGVGLTLYWRAGAPVSEVYHVRLRLVDGEGQVWWEEGGRHAANNYYPTPAWRPGEMVTDYHEFPPLVTSRAAAPSDFIVEVGLFRPFSDEGLTTANGETWYPLARLDPATLVAKSAPRHPLRVRFTDTETGLQRQGREGELMLKGVDLPDVVAAGAPVEMGLHFEALDSADVAGRPAGGFQGRLALTWVDGAGKREQAGVLESWGLSRALLEAPTEAGEYSLRLGIVDQQQRPLRARCGWPGCGAVDCRVAAVRVNPAALAALADFDGKMLLLEAQFEPAGLSPGQSLAVRLNWQGLQPMDKDYTVSVQLVGPDGRLYGQMDAWPVQGTLPTSQWTPGQRVSDPYQVVLAPDAPPGRYRVGVVVYLLATQTRLPVVDTLGRAIGDIAWLGELDVVDR